MTTMIFHARYWKKEVAVSSKPRIKQELDFWGLLNACVPLGAARL